MDKRVDLVEKSFVLNSSILPVEEFSYQFPKSSRILYEVIRVKCSTPIFFEEHLKRLLKSVELSGFSLPNTKLVVEMYLELLSVNPVIEKNTRISLVYSSSKETDLLIYFIPSKYPSVEQFANGVFVKSIKAFRNNPNAKVENVDLRNRADAIIKESGCYEVILLNDNGYMTEGSRSNLFFVKGDAIVTPPLGMVLGGITRQMVIKLCIELNIPLREEMISIEELSSFDAAFITGTSPEVLPINCIDDNKYNPNLPLVRLLAGAYQKLVNSDINKFRVEHSL